LNEEAAGAFPALGMELTHLLVVADSARSRDFYRDVLGADLYREYGGTSVVMRFMGNWILLVTGGPPTEDKPTVTFAAPADPDVVSRAWTIRVPDCRAAYDLLRTRGAAFLTEPVERGHEVRCFLRDPDGHLIELSEYRG
jgi:catechol 2,3-dioxygenase-like lactoylglutathione lyase family enzyme